MYGVINLYNLGLHAEKYIFEVMVSSDSFRVPLHSPVNLAHIFGQPGINFNGIYFTVFIISRHSKITT